MFWPAEAGWRFSSGLGYAMEEVLKCDRCGTEGEDSDERHWARFTIDDRTGKDGPVEVVRLFCPDCAQNFLALFPPFRKPN